MMEKLREKYSRILPLLILFLAPISAQFAFADNFTWTNMTSMTSGQYWSAVTSSNGSIIVASSRGGNIVVSSNSGSTWTNASGTAVGSYFLAMSQNGSKIFAAGNEGGNSYTSSDSGATWVSRTVGGTPMWRPCMSDDGQKILVPTQSGNPRFSNDGGATWANLSALGTAVWTSCAMSLDGTRQYIANLSGVVARSSDSGVTWQTSNPDNANYWSDIQTSDDGAVVYLAGRVSKKIFKSTNFGQSYSSISASLTLLEPYSLATSGDGSRVVVFDYGSTIKSSVDGGSTWSTETSPGSRNWYFGDMSPDGTIVLAPVALNGSYVYRSALIQPALLTLTGGPASSLEYRTLNTLSVTSNYAGKVTFYANGKRIGGCVSLPTNGSLVATCNYRPTIHGAVTITAKIVPTNTLYAAVTSELLRMKIQNRSNTR